MKKKGTILIIDDEEDILFSLKFLLKQHYGSVFTDQNPYQIPRLLRQHEPDVVILDMNFGKGRDSGAEGLEWLRKVKELSPEIPVIMMTAYSDVNIAVEALKSGAQDFLEKPWRNEKVLATVETVFAKTVSEKKVERLERAQKALTQAIDQPFMEIVGDSPEMQEVFATIEKVAATDAHVLVLGENGTGKELIARALHRQSSRAKEVFIPVDMGAIPESLFESELFGHKKGAFTGAHQDRIGRFEAASGGTLFLDEIGNLGMSSQSKLLNALQSHEVIPVGSNKPVKIDIRLICATNMPLYQMVDEQTFRQDLLYRINTVEINLPPLRGRRSDIIPLADHYLNTYKNKYQKKNLEFTPDTLDKLENYHWPGNVRELKHIIERTVIMGDGNNIQADDIILTSSKKASQPVPERILTIDEMEENLIRGVMRKHNGNITKAATELGLTRTSLYRRLEKYGI
ncbi:MAG: sigma-54-dependent Fis family transcriptional regulator [Saprospiraceae bacterium]|nr:sigma-54-dependent Fis family transcriptional regulator [Saprospiraceae bacterium]